MLTAVDSPVLLDVLTNSTAHADSSASIKPEWLIRLLPETNSSRPFGAEKFGLLQD
jgi:hypothetical protein